jgi:SAM-dependent methyltransferase
MSRGLLGQLHSPIAAARAVRTRGLRRAGMVRARGDSVECPCCGHTWSAMAPHRGRPAARCPGCGALERHRLLSLFLQRESDIFHRRVSVLHVAPEEALGSALRRCPGVEYVSGDLTPGRAMEVMDITALPREDDTFDVVICNHVLEHVADDRQAMSEIRRVLKPEGYALLQHPIDTGLVTTYENWEATTPHARMREFGQEDHVRLYGIDFRDRLVSVGFQVSCRRYLDELSDSERERYALRDGHAGSTIRGADIYLCVPGKDETP